MSESVAPFSLHPVVASWRGALENMSPHASPCRNLPPAKWAAIREGGIEFWDRLGGEAHELGWTIEELLAVHPAHGTVRLEARGVLMIGSEPSRSVKTNRIVFERASGYWNTPNRPV